MYAVGSEDDRPVELVYDRVQLLSLVGTSGVERTSSATAILVSFLCIGQGFPDKAIVIRMLKQYPAFIEPESP